MQEAAFSFWPLTGLLTLCAEVVQNQDPTAGAVVHSPSQPAAVRAAWMCPANVKTEVASLVIEEHLQSRSSDGCEAAMCQRSRQVYRGRRVAWSHLSWWWWWWMVMINFCIPASISDQQCLGMQNVSYCSSKPPLTQLFWAWEVLDKRLYYRCALHGTMVHNLLLVFLAEKPFHIQQYCALEQCTNSSCKEGYTQRELHCTLNR